MRHTKSIERKIEDTQRAIGYQHATEKMVNENKEKLASLLSAKKELDLISQQINKQLDEEMGKI